MDRTHRTAPFSYSNVNWVIECECERASPDMDFPTRRKGGGERVSLVNFFFSSSLSLSSLLSSKRERCVNYRSSFLSSAGGSIFVSHRDFRRPVSRNARGKLVEILFILTFVPLRFANIGDKWTREGCCRRRDLYFFSFSLLSLSIIVANFPSWEWKC